MLPNASVEITSLMFRAIRFSLIAMSAALISRLVVTRNASSLRTSPSPGAFCPNSCSTISTGPAASVVEMATDSGAMPV